MGQFDKTIKALEEADRVIERISEENKKLKIENKYLQNSREEMKKAQHESAHYKTLSEHQGLELEKLKARVWELERNENGTQGI